MEKISLTTCDEWKKHKLSSERNSHLLLLLAAVAMAFNLCMECSAKKRNQTEVSFKREETLVLNLERAPKSAKYLILTSIRQAKETQKQLDRAIRQVEQADETFAKATNKRDTRTMTATVTRLKAAMARAQQLEKDLDFANKELKSDVQQTLISR